MSITSLVLMTMTLISFGITQQTEAAPNWAMGLGMESRFQHEVNASYDNTMYLGQLYGRAHFHPLTAQVEWSQEQHQTSSGSLKIRSQSQLVTIWGRYELQNSTRWTPFAGLGVGANFDEIRTEFENSKDTRLGTRGLIGAGGGVSATFFNRLELETEVRVSGVEQSTDALYSWLLRAGVVL